ncbi:MAG: GNVR domain-containing protein [Nitrospirota bacterium]
MDQEQVNSDDGINLYDLWQVLVKRKRIIYLIVGVAFCASIIISLLLPKIYAATTSTYPPQQDSMGISMGMNALAEKGLGGLSGGLFGGKTPADLWVGILKSNTLRDTIIKRFSLKELFHVKTIEDARVALNGRVKIIKGKDEIIAITVEDKDPSRAAKIANAFVEELDKINRGNVMTSGKRTRLFLEKRLHDAKSDLFKAEEEIKVFQENNKAVRIDEQSKAIFGAIGEVRGNLMAKEVELETLLSFTTRNHPKAEILQSEVAGLKNQLRALTEGKKGGNASSKDIFIPTERIPDLGLQYTRLFRNAKVQETLYGLLIQQYELARVQEAKDSPTVQILDFAKVPEKKIKPKRALIVIFSTFTAGFISVFYVFFLSYLEKVCPSRKDQLA